MAEQRLTEQGERIDAELLRDFVHRALAHDVVADPVFELLYAHVADGQLDASLVAASLKPLTWPQRMQTATADSVDRRSIQLS